MSSNSSVSVTINPNSVLTIPIDLSTKEWSMLLPDNIPPFKVEENRRHCSAFHDGIFPGAEKYGDDKQITRIQKFPNYIEFSKILSDELVPVSGQLYLTTKYYDRRKEGWASAEIKKKEGEVMGYCLNGDVYCAADKSQVDKVFYGVVYKSLISKEEAFIKLKKNLKEGLTLELKGAPEEFLFQLKDILLADSK
jgi:hypothetical protein